jgi:DNA-binding MarR family transcriptional regulator
VGEGQQGDVVVGRPVASVAGDGLVSFVVDGRDRRRRRIVLTEAGKARLEQSTKHWSEAQARFERVFGVEKAAALRDLLVGLASPGFAEAFRMDPGSGEAAKAPQ